MPSPPPDRTPTPREVAEILPRHTEHRLPATAPGRRRRRGGLVRRLGLGATLLALVLGSAGVASGAEEQTGGGGVLATTVRGPITPVIAEHLRDGIAQATGEDRDAYLVRLDTPGGLDTSMRAIITDILASEVPVIVWVGPSGARGASAGAIITFSAHVAAMAPGTSIGAATPIAGESGEDLEAKIVNDAAAYAESIAELRDRDVDFVVDTVREGRSASASEALEVGAVDVVSASVPDLLEEVDGTTVTVGDDDREVVLRTAGAQVDEEDLGALASVQQFLANPDIAFLLLSIGTLGLIYELASPGIGVGGALGLTFVLLALFGLAVLPVNTVGIVFLLLAGVLFVAELFAPGVGLAAAGGVLSLVLSGIFLVDDAPGLAVSLVVVLPTALLVGVFVILAGRFALRARSAPSTTTGRGALVGTHGEVRTAHGRPQIFANGAWWGVRPRHPDHALDDGAEVTVVDLDGLDLVVEPRRPPDGDGSPNPEQEGAT